MEYKQLDPVSIENIVSTECFGKRIIYFEEVDSTNLVAKQLGKQEGTHGILVVAEKQNAGRGRLGRNWSSPKGSGIYLSLVLQPEINPEHAAMLTIIAALAVNQGIRKTTGIESYIKWPNDIVINGKKVCGILTEMSSVNEKLECVVIGIGINVSQMSFPKELKSMATSLQMEGKKDVDRSELIINIMNYLEMYYKSFIKEKSLQPIVGEYNSFLVNMGRQVRILDDAASYTGTALGINESGALLVNTEEIIQGEKKSVIKMVVSGEVSVRGIYGYV